MDGPDDAGDHPAAVRDGAYAARLPTPSDEEEDCDDLYGDVNVGFLPLLPLSPSPAPTSPPKTPSPGPACVGSIPFPSPPPPPSLSWAPTSAPKTPSPGCPIPSPSPPPRRAPAPEPQRDPEARPEPAHQPLRPPPPPAAPRHHAPPQPQRAPRGASYPSPPRYTAVYVSDLHWWTTDAEVEAALPRAAAAALCCLHFYSDKFTGKSRGICRAEFLDAAAAASAAAALHGRAFRGRHCAASLARPPALNRLGDDADPCSEAARAPNNPTRGPGNGGRGANSATTVRGNVGPVLGDRPAPAPPPLPAVPRPSPGPPFGGVMGGVGGYGGFQSMGQYNAGIGTGMVPSPLVNPAFLAAGGMAMRGPGVWHDQGMAGGLWGAQQDWNFRGCTMPWQQQLAAPMQHHQAQQQYGNGDYGRGRGRRRERPGARSDERSIGNVIYPDRRQSDRDGGDLYEEHDREEKGRHRERVVEKERGREKHWNERDRHGGDKRRHQEYTENADFDRRGRARSRSQSRDDDYDDRPRRRR
ncbi:unnamed protein product [Urochloa decumbens]|uniref:RRM domain-containing protein n=1 Tax=Urochloa decumbens TaxID=240449 RepID=A0ABC9F4Y3_9POAL